MIRVGGQKTSKFVWHHLWMPPTSIGKVKGDATSLWIGIIGKIGSPAFMLFSGVNPIKSFWHKSYQNWCSKAKFYYALRQLWCNSGQNGFIGLTPGGKQSCKFTNCSLLTKQPKILIYIYYKTIDGNNMCILTLIYSTKEYYNIWLVSFIWSWKLNFK